MIGWIRGLSSIKTMMLVSLATAAITGTTAFIAGVRWEKADRYDDALAQLQLIEDQATQSLVHLNAAWVAAANKAKIDIREWNLQNTSDKELFTRLLAGQADIRSQFDDLEKDIFITTDFGTCKLSDDAVRLLRSAANAANAGVSEP
jgi:hypothetical protein